MTYAVQKAKLGRQPYQIVTILLDYCQNTFGVAPCTGTGEPCYQTRSTCKSVPNYNPTLKNYSFVSQTTRIPDGMPPGIIIPCLQGVAFTPAQIDPSNGIGLRSTVSVTLQDFPHNDRGIDPHADARSYIPMNQGSFFGKLRARNPYYTTRKLSVLSGFLTDDGKIDPTNFQERLYFITDWRGPDANGNVTISGIDVLGLAADSVAQAPAPNTGQLAGDIGSGAGTATLTPAGVGNSEYDAAGVMRIGTEIFRFTRVNDTLTLTTRGTALHPVYGTVAQNHSAGDSCQQCLEFVGAQPSAVVYKLLTEFGGSTSLGVQSGINPLYLDKAGWDAEQALYLPRLYNALIAAPTGVSKLLGEVSEQMGFYIWWDETGHKVRMRASRPASSAEIITLGENYQILEDSFNSQDLPDTWLSEVWVFYGLIDPTQSDTLASNYANSEIVVNQDAESPNLYNQYRVKTIFSRWLNQDAGAAAQELAQTILNRFSQIPREVVLQLDAKDNAIELANFLQVTSRLVQDVTGAPQVMNLQVMQRTEPSVGTTIQLMTREYDFTLPSSGRLIIINDNTDQLNLRAHHDLLFSAPVAGTVVTCIIKNTAVVWSSNSANPAFDVGAWPAGVILKLVIQGWVEGYAGMGGYAGNTVGAYTRNGQNGQAGGLAFRTAYPIQIDNSAGHIWAGAGGGGGGGGSIFSGGGGGGGGTGFGNPGQGFAYEVTSPGPYASAGTAFAPGAGQPSGGAYQYKGGDGGAPASAGQNGSQDPTFHTALGTVAGLGGPPGACIQGNSFITWIATGERLGAIS